MGWKKTEVFSTTGALKMASSKAKSTARPSFCNSRARFPIHLNPVSVSSNSKPYRVGPPTNLYPPPWAAVNWQLPAAGSAGETATREKDKFGRAYIHY